MEKGKIIPKPGDWFLFNSYYDGNRRINGAGKLKTLHNSNILNISVVMSEYILTTGKHYIGASYIGHKHLHKVLWHGSEEMDIRWKKGG